MFTKIRNSWQLMKASWAVLRADKELIWFPILSGITMIILTIVMFIPISAIFAIFDIASGASSEGASSILGYVLMFLYYLISYTVAIFFNTALIGCALIRLDGGEPTFRDGLNIAREKFGIIFQYALISATVGMVLRALQERGGIIGAIVSFIGGLAWNLATFLVIPVFVSQNLSPIDAIKESASLLKRTWGEQVTGNFGLGAIFSLIGIGWFIFSILLIVLFASLELVPLIGLVMFIMIIGFIAIGIMSSALGGIYQAVLYRYAEAGVAPDNFDIEMIQGAFKPKRKR